MIIDKYTSANLMGNTERKDNIEKAVNLTLQRYDTNRSGMLEIDELTIMLIETSKSTALPRNQYSREELQNVLDLIDTDRDGKISKEELVAVLLGRQTPIF